MVAADKITNGATEASEKVWNAWRRQGEGGAGLTSIKSTSHLACGLHIVDHKPAWQLALCCCGNSFAMEQQRQSLKRSRFTISSMTRAFTGRKVTGQSGQQRVCVRWSRNNSFHSFVTIFSSALILLSELFEAFLCKWQVLYNYSFCKHLNKGRHNQTGFVTSFLAALQPSFLFLSISF